MTDAAPGADREQRERVARALWEADSPDVRWEAVAADSWLRSRYRRLADAALAAARPDDDAAAVEWECPSCGATTRARMADHADDSCRPDMRREIELAILLASPIYDTTTAIDEVERIVSEAEQRARSAALDDQS